MAEVTGSNPVAPIAKAPIGVTPLGMLLLIAIILLIVAIAGGAIIHPILFALAIVALVLFFQGR